MDRSDTAPVGVRGWRLLFGPKRWRLGAAMSVIRCPLIELADLDHDQTSQRAGATRNTTCVFNSKNHSYIR